jgi:hypothetical protein
LNASASETSATEHRRRDTKPFIPLPTHAAARRRGRSERPDRATRAIRSARARSGLTDGALGLCFAWRAAGRRACAINGKRAPDSAGVDFCICARRPRTDACILSGSRHADRRDSRSRSGVEHRAPSSDARPGVGRRRSSSARPPEERRKSGGARRLERAAPPPAGGTSSRRRRCRHVPAPV